MSKRTKKNSDPIVQPESQPEPDIEQPSESVEMTDDIEEDMLRKIPRPENIRLCKSCGLGHNLFKTKLSKICVECLNLRDKKPRTEKQIEAFAKAREVKMSKIKERNETIAEFEKQAKQELDRKIVKKAISIKKKQIKASAELDEFSDDDTPLEEVMEVAKKRTSRAKPTQQPKYREQQQTNVVNNQSYPLINFY